MLRNIVFPSIIDAIALDPGEDVFYAGGRDGKIYIAALNAVTDPNNNLDCTFLGVCRSKETKVFCFCRSRSMQMIQQWEKKFHSLHQFCLTELLDGEQAGNA